MKKRFILILIALVLILCITQGVFAVGQQEKGEVVIKLATAYPPGNESEVTATKFKELVENYSNGHIEVKVFLGGSMGGERENIQSLKLGTIQASTIGAMPIHMLAPEYAFMDSPYVLRDEDHWHSAWEGEIGDKIRLILSQNKIKVMGNYYRGRRFLTSNKPLRTLDDISGVKLRVPPAPSFVKVYQEIGFSTIVCGLPELFTSLQTGVADACEGPSTVFLSYRLNEVQKYLNLTNHMVTIGFLIMNEPFLKGLSEQDRMIVEKAASEATVYGDEYARENEKKVIQDLVDGGMTLVEVDRDAFREKAIPGIEKLFEEQWTKTTVEEVNSY